MDPVVMSDTKQTFLGEVYTLRGRYYSRSTRKAERLAGMTANISLHVVVWENCHGKRPAGWHVHHINQNKEDNYLENLKGLSCSDHMKAHLTPERRQQLAKNMVEKAMPAARAWHRSAEGLAWHSQHGRKTYAKRQVRILDCAECGAEFRTKDTKKATRFCHQNCKAKAFRRRRRELKASKMQV